MGLDDCESNFSHSLLLICSDFSDSCARFSGSGVCHKFNLLHPIRWSKQLVQWQLWFFKYLLLRWNSSRYSSRARAKIRATAFISTCGRCDNFVCVASFFFPSSFLFFRVEPITIVIKLYLGLHRKLHELIMERSVLSPVSVWSIKFFFRVANRPSKNKHMYLVILFDLLYCFRKACSSGWKRS